MRLSVVVGREFGPVPCLGLWWGRLVVCCCVHSTNVFGSGVGMGRCCDPVVWCQCLWGGWVAVFGWLMSMSSLVLISLVVLCILWCYVGVE